MLLFRGMEKETIDALKVGDFFVDSPIVFIQRKRNIVSIVTKAGYVFNAHRKFHAYNVFRKKIKTGPCAPPPPPPLPVFQSPEKAEEDNG